MKNIIILGLVFGVFACRNVERKSSYFYLKHNYESSSSACIDTLPVSISQELRDSVYYLHYLLTRNSGIDTISYVLKEDMNFEPIYVINNGLDRTRQFQLVDKVEFSINNKTYQVYKYAYNATVIDGCVTHFWTPELGVFIIRSTTWRNMRILYSTNPVKNDEINTLCRLVWQKPEFYFGCVERMELFPKSMVDKSIEEYLEIKQ